MNVTRRAIHQPIDNHFPETKTVPRSAGFLAMVCVFLAGNFSGMAIAYLVNSSEVALIHGYAKKAGIMHTDPTGIEFWDERINGARGTRGMAEPK